MLLGFCALNRDCDWILCHFTRISFLGDKLKNGGCASASARLKASNHLCDGKEVWHLSASKEARLKELTQELAALLYDEIDIEEVKTLEGIQKAMRGHLLKHVWPELGHFYSHKQRHNPRPSAKRYQHHRPIEY